MHDESLYAERALRAGAMGYIMKQEGTEKVVSAIRRILNGPRVCERGDVLRAFCSKRFTVMSQ